MRQSFTNRTGEDVGKITDQDALHDIGCMTDTLKLLENIREKRIILYGQL